MASIYRRGEVWWIKYYVGRKNVQRSLRTKNAREAEEYRKQYSAAETINLLPQPSSTPIGPFLQNLCEYWRKTRKNKGAASDIGRLRQFFGPVCQALEYPPRTEKRFKEKSPKTPKRRDERNDCFIPVRKLEDLTANVIDACLRERYLADEIAGKTANRYRGVLSSMFTYARKHHGYTCPDRRYRSPIEGVERFPETTPPIRWLNHPQIDEQLKVLEPYPQLRAMVALAIFAGPRREAITWLTHEDVDLDNRVLHIRAKDIDGLQWEPKTGRDRSIPISSRLFDILSDHVPPVDCVWFFPSPEGNHQSASPERPCQRRPLGRRSGEATLRCWHWPTGGRRESTFGLDRGIYLMKSLSKLCFMIFSSGLGGSHVYGARPHLPDERMLVADEAVPWAPVRPRRRDGLGGDLIHCRRAPANSDHVDHYPTGFQQRRCRYGIRPAVMRSVGDQDDAEIFGGHLIPSGHPGKLPQEARCPLAETNAPIASQHVLDGLEASRDVGAGLRGQAADCGLEGVQTAACDNILSIGLRMFALVTLDERQHQRFLVLDEQDCWLRPDLVPRLVKLVHDAGKALGFQVLMVSHHDVRLFQDYADKIYQLEPYQDGGVRMTAYSQHPPEPDA